ncbi:MAG: hypothetical protein NVS3B3_21480 [Aquirhabdus sp.]
MDGKDLVLLGIIVGLGFIVGKKMLGGAKPSALPANAPKEIFTQGAQNGWRYFDDGTVISPDGTYYKNGSPVWAPQ